MKSRKPAILLGLAAILVITLLTAYPGCDSHPSRYRLPETFAYRFEGAAIKDVDLDFMYVAATLWRDDSTRPEAEIRFGGDSLAYIQDSTFFRAVLPSGDYPAGDYEIEIRDSILFHDTLMTRLPDTFAITSVFPDIREKGTETVRLQWSPSTGTEGYVIAAVKRDSAYTGTGFSQYVASLSTLDAFPDSAFGGINDEADTGWYNLYVYAYTGAPDSGLSARLLPVPFPSQLADDIKVVDLQGHFGSVVVTAHDSMHVALLQ
jgi:hypothetical protein